ncbi:MAG TPA: histidine phosphatase family protein [Anaerolineae bacterium]|nr:histidine phosphatase family protein [Anaerolineae bacterium]
MQLLLIRHGQSAGNAAERIQGWNDEPLTDAGRTQALALARRLQREHNVRAIYASPLLRARETAEVIADVLCLHVTFDERLKEHDIGVVTGLSFKEVQARYPEMAKHWQESPWHMPVPGSEDNGAFRRRVMASMDEIVSRHQEDDTVAVVSHGGALGTFLAGLLELDLRKRNPWMLGNASLSVVVLGGVRPRIALLNDTCHLNHLHD